MTMQNKKNAKLVRNGTLSV